MKIYLIGMPYSGKTVIGKQLAQQLKIDFLDINNEIEKEALMFLDEIVEHYGYKTIEKAEQNILEKLVSKDNVVVATNANMVSNKKLKKLLNGIVIYLDADNQILEKRAQDNYPSYLLKETTIEDYNKNNFLLYRNFAHYIVNSNQSIDETILEILKVINKVENK